MGVFLQRMILDYVMSLQFVAPLLHMLYVILMGIVLQGRSRLG